MYFQWGCSAFLLVAFFLLLLSSQIAARYCNSFNVISSVVLRSCQCDRTFTSTFFCHIGIFIICMSVSKCCDDNERLVVFLLRRETVFVTMRWPSRFLFEAKKKDRSIKEMMRSLRWRVPAAVAISFDRLRILLSMRFVQARLFGQTQNKNYSTMGATKNTHWLQYNAFSVYLVFVSTVRCFPSCSTTFFCFNEFFKSLLFNSLHLTGWLFFRESFLFSVLVCTYV